MAPMAAAARADTPVTSTAAVEPASHPAGPMATNRTPAAAREGRPSPWVARAAPALNQATSAAEAAADLTAPTIAVRSAPLLAPAATAAAGAAPILAGVAAAARSSRPI